MFRSLPVTISESGLGLCVICAKNSSQSPSLSPPVMPESDLPLSHDELWGQTVTLGLCIAVRLLLSEEDLWSSSTSLGKSLSL